MDLVFEYSAAIKSYLQLEEESVVISGLGGGENYRRFLELIDHNDVGKLRPATIHILPSLDSSGLVLMAIAGAGLEQCQNGSRSAASLPTSTAGSMFGAGSNPSAFGTMPGGFGSISRLQGLLGPSIYRWLWRRHVEENWNESKVSRRARRITLG
jgi:hypothetical protein